jgi:alpha-tubulin suppressor-like RCC1 family protein
VRAVAAGGTHSCAILQAGLKCWGSNFFGVLGLGDLEARGDGPNEMGDELPLVDVGTGLRVERIALGKDSHTCALLSNDSVKCWGDNDFGQLGIGDFIDRGGYPMQMGDALPAVDLGVGRVPVDLVAGTNHTCAIFPDGSLKCWGNNSNRQLGIGDDYTRGGLVGDMGDALPEVPLGGGRVKQVVAASVHTCALLQDGSVKCWGWQRGFEDAPVKPDEPVTTVYLPGGLSARELGAGGAHTCAALSDGTVRCWAVTDHAFEPVDVMPAVMFQGTDEVARLGVAGGRGCALFAGGSVECWTIPEDGSAMRAERLDLGRRALEMSVAGGRTRYHGCALLDDNSVKCWGQNDQGQLGTGDDVERTGIGGTPLVAVDLGSQG